MTRRPAPALPEASLRGGREAYPPVALRPHGSVPRARPVVAPSAAVDQTLASGWRSDDGSVPGEVRQESTIVLFGARPTVHAWQACAAGRPAVSLLARVRPL